MKLCFQRMKETAGLPFLVNQARTMRQTVSEPVQTRSPKLFLRNISAADRRAHDPDENLPKRVSFFITRIVQLLKTVGKKSGLGSGDGGWHRQGKSGKSDKAVSTT